MTNPVPNIHQIRPCQIKTHQYKHTPFGSKKELSAAQLLDYSIVLKDRHDELIHKLIDLHSHSLELFQR